MSAHRRPLLIAITGADGSGKSTACASVRAALESRFGAGSVLEVSVWDCLGEGQAPFRTKQDAVTYMADLDGVSRALFIFHAMSRALQLGLRSEARALLLNGYWFKYAASEIGYGNPSDWVLSVGRAFPAPDETYCLDVSPEVAWERRRSATAYEQGPGVASGESGERFVAFQRKLRSAWGEIERVAGPWQHISAELPPLEVARQLSERIARRIEDGGLA